LKSTGKKRNLLSVNVENILENISAQLSGFMKQSRQVDIMGVTKTLPVSSIEEAAAAGLKHFGENRVQEAETKIPVLREKYPQLVWHLIGHLQSNKAKKAVQLFDSIDSVDSLKLAQELDRRAKEAAKIMPVMIEINIGAEEQKFGVKPEDVLSLVWEIMGKEGRPGLKNLKLTGLMAVAPIAKTPESARPYFEKMRQTFDEINRQISPLTLQYLSIGMSDDWQVAVQSGSNLIRLGRSIFGRRK